MRIILSSLFALTLLATPSMADAIIPGTVQQEIKVEKMSVHPRKFGNYVQKQGACIKSEEKNGKYVVITTSDKKNVAAYYLLTGTSMYNIPQSAVTGDRSALASITLSDSPASRMRRSASLSCITNDTQVLKKIKDSSNAFRGDFARGSTRALVHTEFGDITIALDAHIAPYAVTNFLELVKAGYFEEQMFTNSKSGVMASGGDTLAANAPAGSKTTIFGTTTFEEKAQCEHLQKTEKNMTEGKNTYVGKWSVLAMTDESSCAVRSGLRIYMENTLVPERDVVIMGTVVSGQAALKKLTQANISPTNAKSYKKFSIELLK